MKNKLLYFAMFAIGASIGSLATWQYTKKKYERIAQEEINSVKEVFLKNESIMKQEKNEVNSEVNNDKEHDEYNKILETENYVLETIEDDSEEEIEENPEDYYVEDKTPDEYSDDICVIPPEEFGEVEGYDIEYLTYYSDGILTDDFGEILEDPESSVGNEYMKHFGEHGDDSVYIRNNVYKCDYEILSDLRTYSEANEDEHYN